MRILIAEDDAISRRVLEATLVKWGYEVVIANDGTEAWETLRSEGAPMLAILDWMMPGLDGPEVCKKLRQMAHPAPPYVILLTALTRKEDVVVGLQAGADDYLTKPFDRGELHARVQVGLRVLDLQRKLAERIAELEEALSRVKQLQGLLPICAYCKRVRDDQNYWQQVESYLTGHSEARFSHSICPECYSKVVLPELEEIREEASRLPQEDG